MSDNRDVGYAILGCGFGIYSFLKGFKVLQKKRLIQDIPTTTIRGLAMGLVELTGKAQKIKPISSPLTNTECVYFRYTIEKYISSGKSSHWVTVSQGDSSYCPFVLDDGTGTIVVFPQKAEFIMPLDFEYQTGLGKGVPENLGNFMGQHGIEYKSFFGNYTMRFREWYITPDKPVFVLGTARKNDGHIDIHFDQISNRIDDLKLASQKEATPLLKKEGYISDDDWSKAVASTEGRMLEEEIKVDSRSDLKNSECIVAKGDESQVFIISDESQTQIINNFSWSAFAGIWGGAALSLSTLAYLLFRLGLWARF